MYGYDIVGDEIVGALTPGSAYTPGLMKRQPTTGSGAPMQPTVQQRAPDRLRSYPLGFAAAAVAASATFAIQRQPQMLFRPQRLSVASGIAANFVITDVSIGSNRQMLTADEFPAQTFSELAVDSALLFDTSDVGALISLSGRNLDAGAPHDFRAIMIGVLLK